MAAEMLEATTANMQKNEHWGEFIDDDTDLSDLKDNQKSDKKTLWANFEFPPLYQPSSTHKGPRKEISKRNLLWMKPPLDSKGQSYLLQSIELQHYKRRMRYMLSAAHSHQNELQKGSSEPPVLPSPPLPPKRYCSNDGHLISQNKPGFLANEFSASASKKNFENKHYKCPIQLDHISARQLFLKSVAAVTAHSGFECATESSLNTLTDVGIEYTLNLCKRLKSRLEHKTSSSNSIDEFSHVLKQSTSEDITSLHTYWLSRIKNVALKLEKEDMTLLNQYNSLKESAARPTIKEEKG